MSKYLIAAWEEIKEDFKPVFLGCSIISIGFVLEIIFKFWWIPLVWVSLFALIMFVLVVVQKVNNKPSDNDHIYDAMRYGIGISKVEYKDWIKKER